MYCTLRIVTKITQRDVECKNEFFDFSKKHFYFLARGCAMSEELERGALTFVAFRLLGWLCVVSRARRKNEPTACSVADHTQLL